MATNSSHVALGHGGRSRQYWHSEQTGRCRQAPPLGEDPTIPMRVRRLRRRRSSGQGLVEFGIVGGLLFFLIFSVMNAGFYLYGANAMQYAADIGVATIAAEGNYENNLAPFPNNADTVAITRMDTDGLNSTPLVRVTEVDIYEQNVTAGVFSNAS